MTLYRLTVPTKKVQLSALREAYQRPHKAKSIYSSTIINLMLCYNFFTEEGEIEEDRAPNEIEDEDWVSPEKLQMLGMHTIQHYFHCYGINVTEYLQ